MFRTGLDTTRLGHIGLQVTGVGVGAWEIGGGGWEYSWSPQRDDQSIAAIHRGLEQGFNWIDTAAAYGFGHSEQVVGRALEGLAERPYVISDPARRGSLRRSHNSSAGWTASMQRAPSRRRGAPRLQGFALRRPQARPAVAPAVRLVHGTVESCVGWRESAAAVADAYGRWSGSPPSKERWRYSAYTASLDYEQAAAAAYELAVAGAEHWHARGRP
jgi:hypothetical protein